MASSWFFILLLKCLDFLSWPVLALGYPLCASIKAIESDSHSETRNLISYWILLSLIYLFEYAFLKLLQWFQYWHYMKLMIVAFLVTPDFGRAAYVYNQLIRSCIYMNPKAVISRFMSWKNIFSKKEDLIMQVEKYITQNGTEALEKLIASKNTEQSLHAETRKAVPTCTEKIEILKTNGGRLLMEQKDIKDLEMIEKEEVLEGKQVDNAALDGLTSNESTSSAMETTEKMLADKEYGTYPQISTTENVQKEWTCAICQLTVPSEANLNSHLQGRKHKAACEALNTKTKGTPVKDTGSGASPQVSASQNEQKTWTCEICQLTILSFADLNSHLQGRKHKASCEALSANTKGTVVADTGSEAFPQVSGSKNEQTKWTCDICQMSKLSEANFKSHLQGKKHKAACETPNMKSELVAEKGWVKKNDKSIGEQEKVINTTSNAKLEQKITNSNHMEHKNISQQNKKRDFVDDANSKVQELKKVGTSVLEMNSCRFRCDMCNVNCTCEADLASHLQGKKHLAQIQLLSGPS
ncbi:hypothetical protein K1719_008738 [Acacia pycnantha]|nr:hypothetical protein K1719_008738 [Acacia pycnantha]